MFVHSAPSLLLSLASVTLYARAQLAGETVQLNTVLTGGADGGNGNCITATQNADGAPVIIKDCGTNATQLNSWLFPNGANAVGTIQIFGDKCLDVTNGVDADGTKLQIWTCAAGNTNQMWVPAGSENPIAWSGKGKCIDLTNGNTTDGNQIQVWDCDSTNNNQRFNIVGVTKPKTTTLKLKGNSALCVTASSATLGAPVVIDKCSSSALQAFSDPTGRAPQELGQLAVTAADGSHLCVGTGSSIADGAKLRLEACDASIATQLWGLSGGPQVNNGGFAKMVLDLTDGNQTPGNQLQIWFGNVFSGAGDNPNQDWLETFVF